MESDISSSQSLYSPDSKEIFLARQIGEMRCSYSHGLSSLEEC